VPTLDDYLALTDGEVRRVRLTRLADPQPTVVYEGRARLTVLRLPAARSGWFRRPAGHLGITPHPTDAHGLSWADYDTSCDYHDGGLVSEDYVFELADLGPSDDATERAARRTADLAAFSDRFAAAFASQGGSVPSAGPDTTAGREQDG
jgi:hypothetical protein